MKLVENIFKLYPQYNQISDRRQQNTPVNSERRSGIDRRDISRVSIDSKLNQDVAKLKQTFSAFITKKDTFSAFRNNNDTFNTGNKVRHDNTILKGALATIPGVRRIVVINDNLKDNGNSIKTTGLGLVALITLKEDLRDILSALGFAKMEAPKDFFAKFKFLAGTLIEKPLSKFKIGKYNIGTYILDNVDSTFGDAQFTEKILNRLNTSSMPDYFNKEIKYPFIKNVETIKRPYIKFDGTFIGKLTGLTLHRITKIGLAVGLLLEMPDITKSLKINNYKQIPKSLTNVVSSIACGALTSSLLAIALAGTSFGPAGSVFGLCFGIYAGNQLANYINSKY